MNIPVLTTCIVLACAVILLLSDRVRSDWVALGSMLVLGISGVLTPQETFAGFSRPAVLTILAIFILAEGLRRTGVTDQAGQYLARLAGKSETRLSIMGMTAGALLSLIMNNIAAAAVMLPAITSAGKKVQARPGKLLIPLAFGTILGGMATLLTTTNIIASGLLSDYHLRGFGLLDFAPMGIFILLVGIAYMAVYGIRMLPGKEVYGDSNLRQLIDIYRLKERLIRCRVKPGSPLVNRPLSQSNLRQKFNLNLISIERKGELITSLAPQTTLQEHDILNLTGKIRELVQTNFRDVFEILPPAPGKNNYLEEEGTTVIEAVLAPRSGLIGKSLRDARIREKYNLNVVGIYRSGKPIRTGLTAQVLQFGDALLLHGPRQQVEFLSQENELIVLNLNGRTKSPNRGKAWPALIIVAVALIASLFPWITVAEVLLAGALAMVVMGVLNMEQAYQSVEWKTVFLVAGMLPLGTALTKTGIAASAAQALVSFVGTSPYALLAGLMLLAVALSQVVHSGVVVTIVAPLAIQIALQVGADPRAMCMGVALATSLTFITPLGHPVNILVMSPGGYRFKDYMLVGAPLTALVFILILALMPVFWPL